MKNIQPARPKRIELESIIDKITLCVNKKIVHCPECDAQIPAKTDEFGVLRHEKCGFVRNLFDDNEGFEPVLVSELDINAEVFRSELNPDRAIIKCGESEDIYLDLTNFKAFDASGVPGKLDISEFGRKILGEKPSVKDCDERLVGDNLLKSLDRFSKFFSYNPDIPDFVVFTSVQNDYKKITIDLGKIATPENLRYSVIEVEDSGKVNTSRGKDLGAQYANTEYCAYVVHNYDEEMIPKHYHLEKDLFRGIFGIFVYGKCVFEVRAEGIKFYRAGGRGFLISVHGENAMFYTNPDGRHERGMVDLYKKGG